MCGPQNSRLQNAAAVDQNQLETGHIISILCAFGLVVRCSIQVFTCSQMIRYENRGMRLLLCPLLGLGFDCAHEAEPAYGGFSAPAAETVAVLHEC